MPLCLPKQHDTAASFLIYNLTFVSLDAAGSALRCSV